LYKKKSSLIQILNEIMKKNHYLKKILSTWN
jgi:hypothetical protein